ncbi:MAG: Phosphate transport ATP-binding protein PstB, partial [uncultured Acidimicrobiales bacterium]
VRHSDDALEHPQHRSGGPQPGRAAGRCRRARLRGQRPRLLLRVLSGAARREPGHRPPAGDRPDRAVGLRQEHLPALPQPHERPDPRHPGRRSHRLSRPGPLRPGCRPHRGASPDRHGLPEAEPVPEVDLRQRGVRPEGERAQAQEHGRPGGGVPPSGCPVGRGEGQAQAERLLPVRWPAAAALHRPGHRRPARRDPHGRALLGARPDRHHPHRGAHGRAQAGLHDRHRDPQHAAGCPRLRRDGVLHGRGRRCRPPHRCAGRGRRHQRPVHLAQGPAHRRLHHRPLRL